MRLAAVACALPVVLLVAALGAVALQRTSVPMASPVPAQAASEEKQPHTVITTLEEQEPAPTDASAAAVSPPKAAPSTTPTIIAENTPAIPATQVAAQAPAAARAPAPAPAAMPRVATSCPDNPDAIGISRAVEIDTTGGPGFGFEHFKAHDFLREGEIVLTFDDGPWPKNTPAVLQALAANCTRAIFFPIGLHATYHPEILKQVAAAGHAIGSHTWCHQDLSKTKGHCLMNGKMETVEYNPKDEIEKGISAVHWAVGAPTAPYFRFPALRQPPELIDYLGKRNIAIFSADLDSFDFKMRKPEQVKQSVLSKLKKNGKGIVLMHDFQHATAEAAMDLLKELKLAGYKVVFMKPKFSVTTLPEYDEMIMKQMKVSGGDARPTSTVVRTISE
jgi:peptidoglycan/xylan/chitin deacetylase (PgdA/CDA1 family)